MQAAVGDAQFARLQQADGHPKVAVHLLEDSQLQVLGTAPNGVEVQCTGLRKGDYMEVLISVYVKDRNLQFPSRVSGAASSARGNASANAGYPSPSLQHVSRTRHQLGTPPPVSEVPAPSHIAAENDDLDAIVEQDKTDGKVTFFFAKTDFVRNFQPSESCKSLPCFQELRRQGALEQVRISKNEALQGKLIQHHASVVSHRWETPKIPDPDGKQLEDISKYLSEKQLVKLMWEDYWCIPQGNRTRAELKYFHWIMEHMDFLYLGCPDVLAIIDMSSQSRFWTQFEAWMAMQTCSQDGLQPASKDKRRCQISCIHSAEPGKDDKKMMELWAQRKPAEAHALLKARDVAVTNQTDKDLWLPLMFELDEAVKNAITVSQAKDLREKGEMAEDLRKAGFPPTQLKEAGYNLTQLREAGYSATDLRGAGCSAKELRDAGYSAKELLRGYSAKELRDAGYSAKELLRGAGYSAKEHRGAWDLRGAGYSAKELHGAGYSAKELRFAGYSVWDLRGAGYSAWEASRAGYSAWEAHKALDATVMPGGV